MSALIRNLARDSAARPCASACGVGSTELVLPLRLWGLCLSLSVVLAGHCPRGGPR